MSSSSPPLLPQEEKGGPPFGVMKKAPSPGEGAFLSSAHGEASLFLDALDATTQALQLVLDVFVATVDVIDAIDDGGPFGHEAGQH